MHIIFTDGHVSHACVNFGHKIRPYTLLSVFVSKHCKVFSIFLLVIQVGLGGFGVTCSPRDPRFEGSNPTKVDGFFQDVKILSTSPPGVTLTWRSRV